MYNLKPEIFDLGSIKGISAKQLDEHYKLYVGYVNKINEIWSKTYIPANYTDSNPTYSNMRSLKRGETYALNGVKLHNLYFENITNGNNKPSGHLFNSIRSQFSSYENFLSYLTNAALSVRGWVILSLDSLDNKLHVIGSDAHDAGAVWLSCPLLVLDVYEHAYFMDFGTDKRKYITTFIENINWKVLNERFDRALASFSSVKLNNYEFVDSRSINE